MKGKRGFQKGEVGYWAGKKRIYKNPKERNARISKTAKTRGVGKWMKNFVGSKNPMFGKHHSEETKQKLRIINKGNANTAYLRILQEIPELEKQGFKCVPIGRVIPDIIGLKNGKVYAIEVERGNPNYSKYTEEIKKFYDDVIWIIR